MCELIEEINRLKEKVNTLSVDLDNVLRMNTPQRVVCKLIKICHGKTDFQLPMTKGTLALQVGIEAETMSRAIHKLGDYGVKLVEKKVSFIDKSRITKTVCDTCAGRDSCRAYKGLTA